MCNWIRFTLWCNKGGVTTGGVFVCKMSKSPPLTDVNRQDLTEKSPWGYKCSGVQSKGMQTAYFQTYRYNVQ